VPRTVRRPGIPDTLRATAHDGQARCRFHVPPVYLAHAFLMLESINLNSCTLTVGHSKTESGTGRLLPLNDRAVAILGFWASLFPLRERNHFVFPAERYGASGDGATVVYDSDPTRPIGRWKEAWESAKIRGGVSCRFHDLRHTGCTRMFEAGVPFSVVATIM
jgi:integrase